MYVWRWGIKIPQIDLWHDLLTPARKIFAFFTCSVINLILHSCILHKAKLAYTKKIASNTLFIIITSRFITEATTLPINNRNKPWPWRLYQHYLLLSSHLPQQRQPLYGLEIPRHKLTLQNWPVWNRWLVNHRRLFLLWREMKTDPKVLPP